MPAAAVIPAPIAYIKVVAVKKLVVGFLQANGRDPPGVLSRGLHTLDHHAALHCVVWVSRLLP